MLVCVSLQPLMQIGLLPGTQLNAVVDAVDRFGKRAFAGFDLMGGEETGHFFALLHGAKITCGSDEIGT